MCLMRRRHAYPENYTYTRSNVLPHGTHLVELGGGCPCCGCVHRNLTCMLHCNGEAPHLNLRGVLQTGAGCMHCGLPLQHGGGWAADC